MTTDPLIGQLVDGRWRVVDRLGAGGMGVVYRAERVKLNKFVALKFLDARFAQSKEWVARFEREARAISRVQNRHVVSILDFGVHQRQPYIVMEYLSGRPLNKEMGRPTMTPQRAVFILGQILDGLKHAHRAGVIHRDLKPENVMLMETTGTGDFVKILDFGLARIVSLDEPSISTPDRVAGTPGYMSPEQVLGGKIDHRTDLYSAGVLLYGMCVGQKPFVADDDLQVLRMHLHSPPPPPRKVVPEKNLSAALEKVILRALEKDRDDRYYHADEMAAALRATPEAGRQKRSRWKGAVAGLLLVGAGATGGVLARQYFQAPPAPAPTPVVVVVESPSPTPEAAPPPDLASPIDLAPLPDLLSVPDLSPTLIETLIDQEKWAEAEQLLRAEQPRTGRVHLQLGEIYFRRIWRHDAEKEWSLALDLDPSLKSDPQLLGHLCPALGEGWKGAGEHFAITRIGREAADAMVECIRSTDDPDKLRAAVRVLERTGQRARIDRELVKARLEQLHPAR